MGIATILRRLTTPLLQVGDLAFDAELSVDRGGDAEFTRDRIGAGVEVSYHSFAVAREFAVEGGVSGIAQLQNLGRPGNSALGEFIDLGLGALEGLTGLDFSSRVQDFEQRLEAVRLARDELEVISKVVGRVRCVLRSWRASTTPTDGESARYRLTLLEVLRGSSSIANATDLAMALTGSGGATPPGGGGPSSATPAEMDLSA